MRPRTDAGARAALALGLLETAAGDFAPARAHLADAVARAHSAALVGVRARAYSGLAECEAAAGDKDEALKYWMLVGTLFDDRDLVPAALAKAAAALRAKGRASEADELEKELRARYPDVKTGDGKGGGT